MTHQVLESLRVSPEIDTLYSPTFIRKQASRVFEKTLGGKTHFRFNQEKLTHTTEYVLTVIKEKYPDLKVPFHSRWGHFKVGGRDRIGELGMKNNESSTREERLELARQKLDLAIVSVLLDAGAGMAWKFKEAKTGNYYSKSEGLALASLSLFQTGQFCLAQKNDFSKVRVDAEQLLKIKEKDIEEGFQVTSNNPLQGVSGRSQLLNSLGNCVLRNSHYFPGKRPGGLIDFFLQQSQVSQNMKISCLDLLQFVLVAMGSIWPGRTQFQNQSVGDVWPLQILNEDLKLPKLDSIQESLKSLVPFHKLSQWMTYSLIEPLIEAGIEVTDVEAMTGLPEYRNGGLFLDLRLIELVNPILSSQKHLVQDALVVEWRALTVHLLDLIGLEVQKKLQLPSAKFPLAKVLEGGTWWAGRKIAQKIRQDGGPPLQIVSDGTVF